MSNAASVVPCVSVLTAAGSASGMCANGNLTRVRAEDRGPLTADLRHQFRAVDEHGRLRTHRAAVTCRWCELERHRDPAVPVRRASTMRCLRQTNSSPDCCRCQQRSPTHCRRIRTMLMSAGGCASRRLVATDSHDGDRNQSARHGRRTTESSVGFIRPDHEFRVPSSVGTCNAKRCVVWYAVAV